MTVSETSPWIRLDPKLWEPFIVKKTPLYVKKNSVLFHQDDSSGQFFIVKSGRIRITTFQRDGSEKQLYIAETGALFGERSCIMGCRHSTTAVAIVDSYVYLVPYYEARETLAANFELNMHLLQLVCRKNAVLARQVVELSFSDSLQRIAQVLINLSEIYGATEPDGICIPIRFTHQDVANLTNTSRVTVSNAFNLLASKKIITKRNGKTVLLDMAALQSMADGHYD